MVKQMLKKGVCEESFFKNSLTFAFSFYIFRALHQKWCRILLDLQMPI